MPTPASSCEPSLNGALDGCLPYTERRTCSRGEVLFRRGDPAHDMFFIEEGTIALTEIGKTLGKGELLGEMGLLCPANRRTVSAVCTQDAVLRLLDRERFLQMMDQAPHQFFSLIQLAISRYAENLQNETAARSRLESELQIAREIQLSTLPSAAARLPFGISFDLAASMDPAREVGGDFYDFFPIGPDLWFMAVGDVSGKGVPAALFMMTVKTLLKAEALSGRRPDDILQHVHQIIYPDNAAAMFVTILCMTINLRTGHLIFGNAGHNPPVISSHAGTECRFLDVAPSPVLGLMPDAAFTFLELDLAAGDAVFLYTDGVTEATNLAGDFFGDEQLGGKLAPLASASSERVIAGVRKAVAEFVGPAPQSDDLTMLAFRYQGPGTASALPAIPPAAPAAVDEPARLVSCRMPATLDYLPAFQACITTRTRLLGFPPERVGDIELALEEVLVNIINYAYPEAVGDIEIQCHGVGASFLIEVIDSGVPFDVTQLAAPQLGEDLAEREIGGLGVYLVKQLMDKVEYCRENGRNHLLLTMKLPTA